MSVSIQVDFSTLGFFVLIGFLVWIDYRVFLTGAEGWIFGYKTEQELRLQEAIIRQRELEAGMQPPENEG